MKIEKINYSLHEEEKKEAQLISPYPTWRRWRHFVEEEFKISFKEGSFPDEKFLHDFYVMRRLQQIRRRIDSERVRLFWEKVKQENPDFLDESGNIVEFIVEKVPVVEG